MKKYHLAFTQAIAKHKKGRNQNIHAFCGAPESFGTNFSPKMPQIKPKNKHFQKKKKKTPGIYPSY